MKSILYHFLWMIKGIKVFALVGKSGSGKSFRAKLIAQKYATDIIIDDGLLIKNEKIIAGKSAKRERNYVSAIKTALFHDHHHRHEVKEKLRKETFKRILIIGTSERMVRKIAAVLELPEPTKIITIQDIATNDEIETALNYRQFQGHHVIPVPAIEVKKNYPRIMADSLKVFLQRRIGFLKQSQIFEKTVVRPEFGRKGHVTISESALTQMILHCIDEFDIQLTIRKITVKHENGGYRLTLHVEVPFGEELASRINNLKTYIIDNIERFTGIIIEELNIDITSIKKRAHEEKIV